MTIKNVIIKKGVIRTLSDRELLMEQLSELQEKFKTDRKIKICLDEFPIKDELIGFDDVKNYFDPSVEFCSIIDGSSDAFIEMLLKEGGKKRLYDTLNTFVKSKYILYLSIKQEDSIT